MNNFPILETEQLVLREFQVPDAQAVFDIFSQDSVTRYVDSATIQFIEEAERKVKGRWVPTSDSNCDIIKVPPDWQVKTETRAIMGDIQDLRGRETPSEETTPDLVMTGKVIMGGVGIKSVAAEIPGDASRGPKREVTKGAA